jgi:ferredoxin
MVATGCTHRKLFLSRNDDDTFDNDEYMVEVIYEGLSCKVPIRGNETILSGLERNQVPDRLGLPELPAQCRRGNCLTCVGRHTPTSQINSLQRTEEGDGLSPELSRQVSKLGYVLACNSHVVGDGVQLVLGENHAAWEDLYVHRLTHESTQYVARSAMAKTIRYYDERHPQQWKVETETILQKSGEPQQLS